MRILGVLVLSLIPISAFIIAYLTKSLEELFVALGITAIIGAIVFTGMFLILYG